MAAADLRRPVCVAGAGSIGVAFAVLFAKAGWTVRCWDPMPDTIDRARHDLRDRLLRLEKHGLLDEPADVAAEHVSFGCSLTDAVSDVCLVQECAPEELELKRELFTALADLAPADAVLASSSSAI